MLSHSFVNNSKIPKQMGSEENKYKRKYKLQTLTLA